MSTLKNLLLILIGVSAVAAQAKLSGSPAFFYETPSLTVPQSILGRSCYSLRASYLDLDCNPAFLAKEEKTIFRMNLVGNDKISVVNRYRMQLNNDDTVGVAESLLAQNTQLVAKAALSLWYQQEWWAVGFVPVRAGIAYLRRNPAFPEISVNAYKELELFGKVGLFSREDENLRIGLQTRFVKRDYLYQQFYALDAVNADAQFLNIRSQNVLYLEPGITYAWQSEWEPEFSWSVSNLAVVQQGDRMPTTPIFDMGFSSNFLQVRGFRSTTHYAYVNGNTDFFSGLSWSGLYDYEDLFTTYLTVGKNMFGLAFDCHFGAFVTGIAYKAELMPVDQWTAQRVSNFTLELGLVF